MLTKAPKGTKDVLPSEVYKWQYVESAFADICARYGFRELRTPEFEHTELFKRGVGDTTDIVQKEMYTWEQAKRSLTLRPEGTSPVVRALVENKLYADVQPQKYDYDIPCFRYEKPQSGRSLQINSGICFLIPVLCIVSPHTAQILRCMMFRTRHRSVLLWKP